MKYLICFFLFSLNLSLYGQNISFYNAGKEIKSLNLESMKKSFKIHTIEVYDQVVHSRKKYKAFSTNEVFTKIYGNSWKNKEEIEFTCADGYKPSFDSSILKKGSSYLAFSYADEEKFSTNITSHNRKDVAMGPLYLVWKAEKGSFIYNKKDSIWPYQLVAFDFISFKKKFPSLYPKGKSPIVNKGFYIFKDHCMKCHSIKKVGGSLAFDLSYPNRVTDYFLKSSLFQYLKDPAKFRYNSNMPKLEIMQSEENRKAVYEYLKTI